MHTWPLSSHQAYLLPHRCCRASDRSQAKYEGDISAWGRKTIPGFYDKRRGGSVTSESDCTMSSGLSPRDGEGRAFDLEGAKNVGASFLPHVSIPHPL